MPWCGEIATRSTFLRSPCTHIPSPPRSFSPILGLPAPPIISDMMNCLMTPDTATEPNPFPLTPVYPTRPSKARKRVLTRGTRASAFHSRLPSFPLFVSFGFPSPLLLALLFLTSPKMSTQSFDIPKECKAGVVVDEGPNFRVEVKMVPVPEIGITPLA
jgi:hypothetical protein